MTNGGRRGNNDQEAFRSAFRGKIDFSGRENASSVYNSDLLRNYLPRRSVKRYCFSKRDRQIDFISTHRFLSVMPISYFELDANRFSLRRSSRATLITEYLLLRSLNINEE